MPRVATPLKRFLSIAELTLAAWSDPITKDIASASPQLGLPSLAGRTVLSTFGLISDSKGLELVIRALPSIIATHPEVLSLLGERGQGHPRGVGRSRAGSPVRRSCG